MELAVDSGSLMVAEGIFSKASGNESSRGKISVCEEQMAKLAGPGHSRLGLEQMTNQSKEIPQLEN
jgi:hypothetical protein